MPAVAEVPPRPAFVRSAPADLEQFVEKLVRGLTYIQLKALLLESYEVRMHLLAPVDAALFTEHLDRHATVFNFAPAVRARVARAADNPLLAIYEFVICERLTVYASVRLKSRDAPLLAGRGRAGDTRNHVDVESPFMGH
jgi:hypothetical protein